MEAEFVESMEQFASSWNAIIGTMPGADIADKAGLKIRWANHPFTFWNAIFLSEQIAKADVLQTRLNEAAAYMRKKDHSGFLFLSEDYLNGSAKENLPATLKKANFEEALPIIGMAGDILALQAPSHPALHLERITNEPMLQQFADINCEAYGLPLEQGKSALHPALWIDGAYSYLGYENEKAVCSASAFVNDGCLFLALVATRPEARNKGYAETVVRHALQTAHEATGLRRTILHATIAGHPIYKRIGYHDTTRITAYKLSS
jgi:GNAT superfamily N-acetyltransferase